MPTNNQQMIAALLRERAAYKQAGKDDRVKQVDEQLKLYGYKSESATEVRRTPPQGRTERPTVTGQSR